MIQKFWKDRRGSGIVTVLIAMFCIVAMGTALLYTSYTGFQVKAAGRKSTDSFYSAETAMDEIRAGLQQAVTDSIGKAYTDMLGSYSRQVTDYTADEAKGNLSLNQWLNQKFRDRFVYYLKLYQVAGTGTLENTEPLYNATNGNQLNFAALERFVTSSVFTTDPNAVGLTWTSTNVSVDNTNPNLLTVQDVAFSYRDANGYQTDLSTDIVIYYPPFTYTPTNYVTSGITQHALIANRSLGVNAGVTLTGDVYAGGLMLNGSSQSLTVAGSELVVGKHAASTGKITVENGAKLVSQTADGNGASIWASQLDITSATAKLTGSTYVANDLALNGTQANVTLEGKYVGFGGKEDAGQSSAILVNGRQATLDMSGLNSLMLGGVAFIDATIAEGGSTFAMGLSVATRSDQLAYLVPLDCLNGALEQNPGILSASESISTTNQTLIQNSTKAYVSALTKNKVTNVTITPVYLVPSSMAGEGIRVCYIFMSFNTQSDANTFFEAYFAANKASIREYLDSYLASYQYLNESTQTAGTYYYYEGTELKTGKASGGVNTAVLQYATQYNDYLSTTGIAGVKGGVDNPYAYHVNTGSTGMGKLTAATDPYVFKNTSNQAVALILKAGNPSSTQVIDLKDYPNVCAIIADGNVTLRNSNGGTQSFHGLLIAGGNVTVEATIGEIGSSDEVEKALSSTATVDGETVVFRDFLNNLSGTEAGSQAATTEVADSWDVDELVVYSNWKKS